MSHITRLATVIVSLAFITLLPFLAVSAGADDARPPAALDRRLPDAGPAVAAMDGVEQHPPALSYSISLPFALRGRPAPGPGPSPVPTSSPEPTLPPRPSPEPSPSPQPSPSPEPGALELVVTPPEINNSVPGQRCVFLVAVNGDPAAGPVHLSATAEGAAVTVVPENPVPGTVAELWVVPPLTDGEHIGAESTVPIAIRASRDGDVATATASLLVIDDLPGVDEERAVHAAEVRDRFVPWLAANHPELGITPDTSWQGTIVTPRILVVMHYLFFSPEWEMHVAWHVMIPPHDWARIDLRHRYDETMPSLAYEISSWSQNTEPHPMELPDRLWR